VDAVAYYDDPEKLAAISRGLGEPMSGLSTAVMEAEERLAGRGW
jgi:pyridoxal 5'-phosphate synthase pdxS subunit